MLKGPLSPRVLPSGTQATMKGSVKYIGFSLPVCHWGVPKVTMNPSSAIITVAGVESECLLLQGEYTGFLCELPNHD